MPEAARLAVLCDIHGNAPALHAVLAELAADPPDAVVIGGDVAAGPMPMEVLARLRELPWPVHWVRGNADRALVMSYDGTAPERWRDHPIWIADAWTATRIPRAERDFLEALPPLQRFEVAEIGEVLFCHGSPRSDEERVTVFTPEERLGAILAAGGAPFVVAGHTHRQFDAVAGGRRMVNAGSVGRPYEHEPGAYWLRLGPDVRLMRTPYDTRSRHGGLPGARLPRGGHHARARGRGRRRGALRGGERRAAGPGVGHGALTGHRANPGMRAEGHGSGL